MKYKYIEITKEKDFFGDIWYLIKNNKSGKRLGTIDYEERWKQWVFMPGRGCIFSWDCLRDIIDFIKNHITEE